MPGEINESDIDQCGYIQNDGQCPASSFLHSYKSSATIKQFQHAIYYKMDYKFRGVALIFNHYKYKNNHKESIRSGTEVYCTDLKEVLKTLGFDVRIFQDFTKEEIKDCIREVAMIVYGFPFSLTVDAMDVSEPLTSASMWTIYGTPSLRTSVPHLQESPNYFSYKHVAAMNPTEVTASLVKVRPFDTGAIYSIPSQADFLMFYATPQGYYSWRSPDFDSWFIQSLCEQMRKYAFDMDLLTLCNIVTQSVTEYVHYPIEKQRIEYRLPERIKEVSCLASMLTKLVKFEPKESK